MFSSALTIALMFSGLLPGWMLTDPLIPPLSLANPATLLGTALPDHSSESAATTWRPDCQVKVFSNLVYLLDMNRWPQGLITCGVLAGDTGRNLDYFPAQKNVSISLLFLLMY